MGATDLQKWASSSSPGPREQGPHVYFVSGADHLDYLKIGWTSRHTKERVRALQSGNPSRLRALLTFPGPESLEREMHERFAPLRGSGEWFRVGSDLSALVDMCLSVELRRRAEGEQMGVCAARVIARLEAHRAGAGP